jgi:Golgi phosphoprotein 3 (GPP34)
MQKDPSRRRFPLPDRVVEVIDDTLTGEVLLDEALKMMKSSEKMSVSTWIDLMSGACLIIPSFCPSHWHRILDHLASLGKR